MVTFDLHSRHGVSTAATFDQVSRHLPGQAGLRLIYARSKQRKKLENVFCIKLNSNISIWFNMSIICILSLEACIICGTPYGKHCFFKPEAPMPGKSGRDGHIGQIWVRRHERSRQDRQDGRILEVKQKGLVWKSKVGMTQFNVNKTACQTKRVRTCAKSRRKQELIFNLCVCMILVCSSEW